MSDTPNEAAEKGVEAWVGSQQPWIVFVITAVLALIFLIELSGNCGDGTEIEISRLLAMGAVSGNTVSDGQWYRLLTAAFLHFDWRHLLLNCFAFVWAYTLEKMIGPAWFLFLFLISAIGGAVFSVTFHDSYIVSAGASGAVLGVFGAQLAIAKMGLPEGKLSAAFVDTSWRVLLPTLAASFIGSHKATIDLAAHIGGALAGSLAAAALVLFLDWEPGWSRPPASWFAWLAGGLGCVVVLYGMGPALVSPVCSSQPASDSFTLSPLKKSP